MDQNTVFGPKLKISQQIHKEKYRLPEESFEQSMIRVASALSDNSVHQRELLEILLNQRFLPAGRIQTGAGSNKAVTLYNCFVSGDINDNFTGPTGIMERATEAAETMRRGGGVGYNFGSLRPRNDLIKSLGSLASGPVSFMHIYDAVCKTVSSAGHRRGAQMGVLPVWHPDILEFVQAKQNDHSLTAFNLSVGITDDFMQALDNKEKFSLKFNGKDYLQVDSVELWNDIMKSTWNFAEPGVIFLDTINHWNNLWYCEYIQTTNPCSEQPLPANGACLLGSFNLVKYVDKNIEGELVFDYRRFIHDIHIIIRAMDNVIEKSMYPLAAQKEEALNKRRMGLGITGFANASEILGFSYGSNKSLKFLGAVLRTLRDYSYEESINLAREKGSFPLFEREQYLQGKFIETLPKEIKEQIEKHGIRNSHLTSIAPTGTISITADNVSSGIEPVWSLGYHRKVNTLKGPITEFFSDYAFREHRIVSKTADECTAQEHLSVLLLAQTYVDSAVSKTCNVSNKMPWTDFKELYSQAWRGGAKGLSTFNVNGKRKGILTHEKDRSDFKEIGYKEILDDEQESLSCYIDKETGQRSCG